MQDYNNNEIFCKAEKAAETLAQKLKKHSVTVALAESCTAGLVSGMLAGISGVSAVLWGSFVCYTKEAKIAMLGVDRGIIETYGLVSEQTARAMAEGALQKSGADIAAAVTGLAGPAGDGSPCGAPCGAPYGAPVPVGTVWVAAASKNRTISAKEFHFKGGRNEVRILAAIAVLEAVDALT